MGSEMSTPYVYTPRFGTAATRGHHAVRRCDQDACADAPQEFGDGGNMSERLVAQSRPATQIGA